MRKAPPPAKSLKDLYKPMPGQRPASPPGPPDGGSRPGDRGGESDRGGTGETRSDSAGKSDAG